VLSSTVLRFLPLKKIFLPRPPVHALHSELFNILHSLAMTDSSSLTVELQHASSNNYNVGNAPLLFSIGNNQSLSYDTCWDIVHLHKKWISNKIISARDDAWKIDEHIKLSSQPKIDVVIGYLADNSPDLLLSMLGCIDLAHCTSTKSNSSDSNECAKALSPLPAMINVRWTPFEIQQALRVHADNIEKETVDATRLHITIILYGQGYEASARQAVHLMTGDTINQHFAVALPLPFFGNDMNSTPNHRSSWQLFKQKKDIQLRRTHSLHIGNILTQWSQGRTIITSIAIYSSTGQNLPSM